MRSRRKLANQAVELTDLYALKIGALWKALKSEHVSLWMLCLYFFFEYVRPQSLYPVLDVMPYNQIFLLAAIVTAFADKSVSWVAHTENKLLFAFYFVLVLSGVAAYDPQWSWDYRNVMLGWFLLYFLMITIVNSERRFILFLLAYLLFSFKMAQHGAIAWASRGFSFSSWGLVGAPGYFRNSGEFAIQMLIYGSLTTALVISLKDYWGRYKKWFMYFAAAAGVMSVMGASSRGSQIGLAVIGIWILLKQKGGFKGLVSLVVIAGILYLILPDEQIARFTEMGDDKSSQQRLDYWGFAWNEVIPENLILGVGYNNWFPYAVHISPEGIGVIGHIQEVHNIYLQVTAELGIFGLFMFVLLIVYAFITNARTRRLASELDKRLYFNLSYGLDAGLIGYLVAATFVTVMYYPFFWVQIAMIVMLNNVVAKTARQKEPSAGGGSRRGRFNS